jgi:hypothetical protein
LSGVSLVSLLGVFFGFGRLNSVGSGLFHFGVLLLKIDLTNILLFPLLLYLIGDLLVLAWFVLGYGLAILGLARAIGWMGSILSWFLLLRPWLLRQLLAMSLV